MKTAGRPRPAVDMPSRIRALPRDDKGRPIPWFVATLPDGRRDFRVVDPRRRIEAIRDGVCWVCGQKLPRAEYTFLLGPMCTLNRITGEPPSHYQCALYAVKVCPFMVRPQMVRRTGGLDGVDLTPPPGVHVDGNPGGIVLWMCRGYKLSRPPIGQAGILITVGDPVGIGWWTQGRPAGREEAAAILRAGYERLLGVAEVDPDPESAIAELRRQMNGAVALLPDS